MANAINMTHTDANKRTCFSFRVEKAGLNMCLDIFEISLLDENRARGYPFASSKRPTKVCKQYVKRIVHIFFAD